MPSRLPAILSREEVAALIKKTTNLKDRAFLMTTYGAGLRLLETCQLRIADLDSERMTLRVEQGNGAKDSYTLLSPRLLAELRRYWPAYRPKQWLFPSPRHTGIGRPCGAVQHLWPRALRLPFLPQPSLPEVSNTSQGALAQPRSLHPPCGPTEPPKNCSHLRSPSRIRCVSRHPARCS